jgi:hypothetical protein
MPDEVKQEMCAGQEATMFACAVNQYAHVGGLLRRKSYRMEPCPNRKTEKACHDCAGERGVVIVTKSVTAS